MPRSLLILPALLFAFPAHAQYTDAERLEKMEKKLNTLERAYYRGEQPSAPAQDQGDGNMSLAEASSTQVRLQQLEEKIGTLQGKIEELEHQLTQLHNAAVGTYTTGQGEAPAPTPITPDWGMNPSDQQQQMAGTQVSEGGLSNPVEDKYEQAFAALRDKNYPAAIQGFQEFVQTYPDHNLVGNAYYWMGEAYYAQKDYEQASVQFMQGFQTQPKGNKAPDNLLKLGMALGNLDKKKEACATYNKVLTDYPAASVSLRQRAAQEQANLKCN